MRIPYNKSQGIVDVVFHCLVYCRRVAIETTVKHLEIAMEDMNVNTGSIWECHGGAKRNKIYKMTVSNTYMCKNVLQSFQMNFFTTKSHRK